MSFGFMLAAVVESDSIVLYYCNKTMLSDSATAANMKPKLIHYFCLLAHL